MAEQERQHLAAFERLLAERGVRPTALSPLWRAAGFALGAASALAGPRAAMACTVAVEEEIDAHYARQIEALEADRAGGDEDGGSDSAGGGDDGALAATLAGFRAHRDAARAHGAADGSAWAPFGALIRTPAAAPRSGSRNASDGGVRRPRRLPRSPADGLRVSRRRRFPLRRTGAGASLMADRTVSGGACRRPAGNCRSSRRS